MKRKFPDLIECFRAKILAKIKAAEDKISFFFSQKGVLRTDF